MTLPTQRFTQYPTASTGDYEDATMFLIANSDGEIKQASLTGLQTNYFCNIGCARIFIPSADVLNLNSSVQTILSGQGIGKLVSPILVDVQFSNGTTKYDTNVDLEVRVFGSGIPIFESDTILNADQDCTRRMQPYTTSFVDSDTQLISNSSIYIWSPTGAPATGDYDLHVTMLYYQYQQ